MHGCMGVWCISVWVHGCMDAWNFLLLVCGCTGAWLYGVCVYAFNHKTLHGCMHLKGAFVASDTPHKSALKKCEVSSCRKKRKILFEQQFW